MHGAFDNLVVMHDVGRIMVVEIVPTLVSAFVYVVFVTNKLNVRFDMRLSLPVYVHVHLANRGVARHIRAQQCVRVAKTIHGVPNGV